MRRGGWGIGIDGQIDVNFRKRLEKLHGLRRARGLKICLQAKDGFPSLKSAGGVGAIALDHGFDDRYLLVGKGDGSVGLFDLEVRGMVEASQAKSHDYGVSCLTFFGGDNGIFISGSTDKNVMVWDTAAFVSLCKFRLFKIVHSVSMSPVAGGHTSKLVACGTDDNRIRLCDISSGAHSQVLEGHRGSVFTGAWSPLSEFVFASGSSDKTIRLWDVRRSGEHACFASLDLQSMRGISGRGKKRALVDMQNISHDGAVMEIQFVAQGNYILSSGADSKLRLWQATGASGGHDYGKHFLYENTFANYYMESGIPLSPSGKFAVCDNACPSAQTTVYCVTGLDGTTLSSFDVLTGNCLQNDQPNGVMDTQGHFTKIVGLVFRESMQQLYSASIDGTILKWDASANDLEEGKDDNGINQNRLLDQRRHHGDDEDDDYMLRDDWYSEDED